MELRRTADTARGSVDAGDQQRQRRDGATPLTGAGLLSGVLRHRLARYVAEGRRLRAVFGSGGYRLLAVGEGRFPAILLWSTRADHFTLLRNAIWLEWDRLRRGFFRQP